MNGGGEKVQRPGVLHRGGEAGAGGTELATSQALLP